MKNLKKLKKLTWEQHIKLDSSAMVKSLLSKEVSKKDVSNFLKSLYIFYSYYEDDFYLFHKELPILSNDYPTKPLTFQLHASIKNAHPSKKLDYSSYLGLCYLILGSAKGAKLIEQHLNNHNIEVPDFFKSSPPKENWEKLNSLIMDKNIPAVVRKVNILYQELCLLMKNNKDR